ncbi:hypothetical protein [Streptomyces sp. NPDC048669]|uniref:hypothetical protein n=1 Tax=Streptomyces sp. NPDC048669 TaxID=3155267 RepID=UPI003444C0F6
MRDFADLSAALRGVYEQAGAPPLRTMEKRAGALGALPRSSAHRMVNKQMVPHTLDQFRGFLRACEVPADWKVWEDAWNRAWRFEKQEDAGLNEIEIWNADPQWNEPAPPRVLLRQTRRGSEENRQDPVSGEDKAYVTASGPEYYRPLVPRQRSITGRTPVKAVARIVHSRIRSARDPAELRAAELAEEQLHSWAKPVDTETLF